MTSKGEFFGELEVEFEAAVDYELWFDLWYKNRCTKSRASLPLTDHQSACDFPFLFFPLIFPLYFLRSDPPANVIFYDGFKRIRPRLVISQLTEF